MAEDLKIPETSDRKALYEAVLPQIEALTTGESDLIANLANISAALKEVLGFFWIGFYRVEGKELILGPFQGPVACTRIAYGKGVCGAAWKEKRIIIVPDVDAFPGHIACSSASKSEIVLPVYKNGEVAWILDIDSDILNDFDSLDEKYLSLLIKHAEKLI
ncbi:MAG: GAF domain-containing protein [Cyclobacteriaceae bacterium]|nr:GAF domain-containing protein [Cyclobacteriaceae bacterium]